MVGTRNPAYIGEQLLEKRLNGGFILCSANLRNYGIRSPEIAICLTDSASLHVCEHCLKLSGDNRL
jgi:hypothetical protein